MPLNKVTLTGTYVDGSGSPLSGSLQFVPTAPLYDTTDEIVVRQKLVTAALSAEGTFSVQLLATDNANLVPSGWAMTVKELIAGLPPYIWSFNLDASPFSFTVTDASPAVFSAPGSAYADGAQLVLSNLSGAAPFAAATTYFVVNASGDTFGLAATSGGSAIGSTSSGSGTVATASVDISTLEPLAVAPMTPPFMPLSGGTMLGPLTLDGNPATALMAAPKQYVDAEETRAVAAESALTADIAGLMPLLTQTAVKTGNYTAAANQLVPVSTTSASLTVTLPAAPANGTLAAVKQVATSGSFATTIAAAGSDVLNKAGGGTTMTLSLLNQGALLQYDSGIWLVLSDDLPLSQLDARYAQLAGAAMLGEFVTQAPNIVFDGDSLTNGTGSLPFNGFPSSNDYPSQVVAALDPAGTYYNVGVGGEQTSTMITNGASVVDSKLVSGANNVVCFHGGTNDIFFGATDTTTYGRIVTYCQARRAAGWKVIVGTLTPRSDAGVPGNQDTYRLSVNTQIRANWTTFADGIADIGADANMGTLGQETDTRYYNGDDVHHNPTGYQVLASYFLSALKKLGIAGHVQRDRQDLVSDLWVPASAFSLYAGTPTLALADLWPVWEMHHGQTDTLTGSVLLPRNWRTFQAGLMWSNTAGGSGNVAWRLDTVPLGAGTNLTSVVAGAQTNIAAGASNIAVLSILSGVTYNANQGGVPRIMQGFRVLRLGTSGSDTYTSDADLLGLYLFRTS